MSQIKFADIKDRPFMTIEEAAVFTHIGEESLRRLAAEDDCDFVFSIGKKKLIKRDAIVDYISSLDIIY